MNKHLKLLAYTAILLAVALIIGFIEQSIPSIFPGLPFVKIGFGNIVILFTLITLGHKPAYIVSTLKAVLVPIFVGNPVMIAYSLPASLVALTLTVILLNTKKISLTTVSTISAIIHIFVQVCVAAIMTNSGLVFGYMGYLLIISSLSGFAVGIITALLLRKMPDLKLL